MNFTEQVNISLENIDIKKLDLNSFELLFLFCIIY